MDYSIYFTYLFFLNFPTFYHFTYLQNHTTFHNIIIMPSNNISFIFLLIYLFQMICNFSTKFKEKLIILESKVLK